MGWVRLKSGVACRHLGADALGVGSTHDGQLVVPVDEKVGACAVHTQQDGRWGAAVCRQLPQLVGDATADLGDLRQYELSSLLARAHTSSMWSQSNSCWHAWSAPRCSVASSSKLMCTSSTVLISLLLFAMVTDCAESRTVLQYRLFNVWYN